MIICFSILVPGRSDLRFENLFFSFTLEMVIFLLWDGVVVLEIHSVREMFKRIFNN